MPVCGTYLRDSEFEKYIKTIHIQDKVISDFNRPHPPRKNVQAMARFLLDVERMLEFIIENPIVFECSPIEAGAEKVKNNNELKNFRDGILEVYDQLSGHHFMNILRIARRNGLTEIAERVEGRIGSALVTLEDTIRSLSFVLEEEGIDDELPDPLDPRMAPDETGGKVIEWD